VVLGFDDRGFWERWDDEEVFGVEYRVDLI